MNLERFLIIILSFLGFIAPGMIGIAIYNPVFFESVNTLKLCFLSIALTSPTFLLGTMVFAKDYPLAILQDKDIMRIFSLPAILNICILAFGILYYVFIEQTILAFYGIYLLTILVIGFVVWSIYFIQYIINRIKRR